MSEDLLWELETKRISFSQVLAGVTSVLIQYKKTKDALALRDQLLEGLKLLQMFGQAEEFLLQPGGKSERAWRICTIVRRAFFEERVPLGAPGREEWNQAINHELLKELCLITSRTPSFMRILEGIVYSPREEFSLEKTEALCNFFEYLLMLFSDRPR